MSRFDASLFAPDGALASAVEGYRAREGQLKLSQAIADNFANKGVLLAEAGTGTGKTFAYLLPALNETHKVLVSTATKNLQEQIFEHDLPLVKRVLRSSNKVALLKGRRNYYCHHHHRQLLETPPEDKTEQYFRAEVARFAEHTKDGDLVGLSNIPEDAAIMQNITSTADNCLGRECDFYEQCFLQRARQRAKDADVIVVNHHLLLADFTLRSEGFAEILPEVDAFIIDEAHHLPDTAINFMGTRLSARKIQNLLNDVKIAQLQEAPDAIDLANNLPKATKTVQDCILSLRVNQETRLADEALAQADEFWQALTAVAESLLLLQQHLSKHKERGKLLANVYERCVALLHDVVHFLPQAPVALALEAAALATEMSAEMSQPVSGEMFANTQHEVANIPSDKTTNVDTAPINDSVHAMWLDINPRGFMLSSVPVDAASRFAGWIKRSEASWTFLSATLAVGGKFDHFARQLGLSDYQEITMLSPFDYPKQAVLFHPTNLPDTKSSHYTERLLEEILPILTLSKGRAFLLFTSYRAMYEAERWMKKQPFELFVQGKAPKAQLLKDFRAAHNGVLLATASFWEGVDVRGDALVCVVIDKLPFSAPNDPVTKMRHKLLQEKNLSPFMHDSLPQAVITLKQGVGRLIRGEQDYGVLVIGDPRLSQKGYGKTFIDSLPPMTKTTKISTVARFFAYHEGPSTHDPHS